MEYSREFEKCWDSRDICFASYPRKAEKDEASLWFENGRLSALNEINHKIMYKLSDR